MATYENPYAKGKPIKTIDRGIGRGINNMINTFSNNKKAEAEKKQRDSKEAEILLNKHTAGVDKAFVTGYDSMQKDINTFASNAGEGNRNVFKDEIYGILNGERERLIKELNDNPQATEMQRVQMKNDGLAIQQKMTDFMANMVVAREQYLAAREIPMGQEGSLVPNYNPQMIKFFEAQERNDPNTHLTLDDNGDIRVSIVNEEELGSTLDGMGENDILEFTTFNATEWGNNARENGAFKTVQPPDYSTIKDVIDQEIKSPDNPGRFGKKVGDNIVYDQEAIQEFMSTDPAGMKIMDRMVGSDDKYGQWMSMGEDMDVVDQTGTAMGPTMTTAWSNTVDTYNDDLFREGLIGGAMELFPAPKPKPQSTTSTQTDSKKEKGGKETLANIRDTKPQKSR